MITSDRSYQVIKFREVRIAKKVKRSDAGDVSPVPMFFNKVCIKNPRNFMENVIMFTGIYGSGCLVVLMAW